MYGCVLILFRLCLLFLPGTLTGHIASFGGKKYRDLLGTLGVFRDWCEPAATCRVEQEWQLSLLSGATLWWKRAGLPYSCSGLGPCSFLHASQFLSMWSTNHVLVFY